MRKYLNLLPCLLPLLLSGCPNSRSSAISNSEFYVVTTIVGDPTNNKVSCSTSLAVGGAGGTTISLDAEDSLTCTVDSDAHAMSEGSAGSYAYTSMAYGVGKSYSVALTRKGSDECGRSGTFTGTAVLPEAVTVTAPAASASVSKASALNVTWQAGTGDSISIYLNPTAGGTPASISTTDTGAYTIPSSTLTGMTNGVATLTITRSNIGQHPSGIKGGATTASQQQSVSITLTN